jgi:hypothetical protein
VPAKYLQAHPNNLNSLWYNCCINKPFKPGILMMKNLIALMACAVISCYAAERQVDMNVYMYGKEKENRIMNWMEAIYNPKNPTSEPQKPLKNSRKPRVLKDPEVVRKLRRKLADQKNTPGKIEKKR